MTTDKPKSGLEAFNERARFSLDTLDFTLRRDVLTTMKVMALAKNVDGLTELKDRVHAADLLSRYIFEDTTLGPAVFQGWDRLVRKIAEDDLPQACRFAGDAYNKLRGGEQLYGKVSQLFFDISSVWEANRQRALMRYDND